MMDNIVTPAQFWSAVKFLRSVPADSPWTSEHVRLHARVIEAEKRLVRLGQMSPRRPWEMPLVFRSAPI